MYILRNALKCIIRSFGRNILIGLIVLVISISSCIGLSIRQAAENAKKEELENLSVTATINFDRSSFMNEMKELQGDENSMGGPPAFDRSEFKNQMGQFSSLTLEEYEKYAKAESIDDFYYSTSVSLNGSDNFEPISNTENTSIQHNDIPMGDFRGMENGAFLGGRERMMGVQSDFTVEGYSSESAMTSFANGTISIVDGEIFEEGTNEYQCVISQELATYNEISIGDKIKLTNPNQEDEIYKLKVVGFYSDSSSNSNSFSMMGATSTDPANKIYMSYNSLKDIVEKSKENTNTVTDENTGIEFETALNEMLSATYVFDDADSYYKFEDEVRQLGLEDTYTVSSQDISAYENSLLPLNTLSSMAGTFLIVILIIGAVILVVLNVFNVRERKYEIGVLTAMGMKKSKVSLQFLTEIFIVTLVAVMIGVGVGAVTSVPVTNTLLENQIKAKEDTYQQREENFGRGGQMPVDKPDGMPNLDFESRNPFGEQVNNYISEINSAMNFTVVWQMLGIAVLLTLISGVASMLFVMRYEPLKILANRD